MEFLQEYHGDHVVQRIMGWKNDHFQAHAIQTNQLKDMFILAGKSRRRAIGGEHAIP